MLEADADHRIKITARDRIPKSTDIRCKVGDDIVFIDYKEGRMREGKMIGRDGPNAIVRYGNQTRKVPTRELLTRTMERIENQTEEEFSEQEIDIEEITPINNGNKRKREVIIQDTIPDKVGQESEDKTPSKEIWIEDDS